jgi:hypothetical protein
MAALPIGFVAGEVATWVRNIPSWDEFDTALDLLITLDSGASGGETVARLLAVQNEHRMLVSRLLFAVGYWLFGGIDFAVVALIGNLFLAATFALLVGWAAAPLPRLRLAAILGLVVCQLQHHESFFWGGSSIDHFLVVLLAVAALGALSAPGRMRLTLAVGAAVLATFTLAHGLVVWPVGAALLWLTDRRRAAAIWSAAAAVTGALFFLGFQFNPGHRLPGPAEWLQVGRYWLALAGSSPALDHAPLAPWLGALFVAAAAAVLRRGATGRETFAAAALVWCVGAMAMIAWGRALLSEPGTPVTSRYIILSSLAWALLLWLVLERALARSRTAPRWPVPVFAGLVLFNLAANGAHSAAGRVYAQRVEQALAAFHRHGTLAAAVAPLYPDSDRADALLRAAVARHLVALPPPAALTLATPTPIAVTDAVELADASYFIEDAAVGTDEVRVRGWAYRADETTRLGDISVIFRTPEGLLAFDAIPQLRPDVAAVEARWDALHAGFELRIPRDRLPVGELGVGVGFELDDSPEYMMTASAVTVPPP